jgi:hypothetical protein
MDEKSMEGAIAEEGGAALDMERIRRPRPIAGSRGFGGDVAGACF